MKKIWTTEKIVHFKLFQEIRYFWHRCPSYQIRDSSHLDFQFNVLFLLFWITFRIIWTVSATSVSVFKRSLQKLGLPVDSQGTPGVSWKWGNWKTLKSLRLFVFYVFYSSKTMANDDDEAPLLGQMRVEGKSGKYMSETPVNWIIEMIIGRSRQNAFPLIITFPFFIN